MPNKKSFNKLWQRGGFLLPPLFLIFILNILCIQIAFSQELQTYLLSSVVVTAKKEKKEKKQVGDVDLETTPSFYTLIKKSRFEGKMETLSDVLKKQTGVQIRETGGIGSFSTISLRGAETQQVMIFLDGILLNDAEGGLVDLSTIPLSDVEYIEIFKGITPVNFGKASIGGVVNIVTKRTEKGLKGSVTIGYGSFDTKKMSVFLNYKPKKPKKWDILLCAGMLDTQNNFKFLNDRGTVYNTQDDRIEERHNAQVSAQNFLIKAGYDFSRNFRTEVSNQWFYKHQGLPDRRNSPRADTTYDIKRNITILFFSSRNFLRKPVNWRFSLNRFWKWEQYDDSSGWIGLGKQKNIYITERYGGNIYTEYLTEHITFGGDVEAYRETYKTKALLQPQNPRDSDRTYFSTAFQPAILLLNSQLIIAPAIRYTWIKDHLRSKTSIWGLPLPSKTREKDYFEPQIGVKYHPFKWLTLKSNLAQYVREPTFFELFGDRGYFIGNDELKSEKGINFDTGFIINKKLKHKYFQKVKLEACYFLSRVKDLITKTFDARGVGKFVNVSDARIEGAEFDGEINFFKYFNFISRITLQDPKNLSSISVYNEKQLPGRYKRIYFFRFETSIKDKFKFYIERLIQKEMYYDTVNLLPAKDKDQVNMGISVKYKKLKFSLDIKNVFDKQFEDFNGYPLPGRSIFVAFQYIF